jgi:hypothetical protein
MDLECFVAHACHRFRHSRVAIRSNSAATERRNGVCFEFQIGNMTTANEIDRAVMDLLSRRDADVSICPSEAARALAPHSGQSWRALMPNVRAVAAHMARAGRIRITRGDVELDPGELGGGPIRLRRGPRFDDL